MWSTLYNLLTTYLPRVRISDGIEILLLTLIFYYMIKWLRGTRAYVLLKGVAIVLASYAIVYLLNFEVLKILFQSMLMFIGIAIVVIMQPELRKMLEYIGTKNLNMSLVKLFNSIFKDSKTPSEEKLISDFTIQELIRGCFIMGKAKTGALIVIERDIPLNDYAESGIEVDARITSQLLINIFEHNTPLHDGAVVIQKDKVAAATCYLPLSDNKDIDKDLGTRHRAGIGISEVTDAVVIIVSEETGSVSFAKDGRLYHNLDREDLSELLKSIQVVNPDKSKVKINISTVNMASKILCLVGAFLTWSIIITSHNPIVNDIYKDIPVTIINDYVLADTGKTYQITNGDSVDVSITATKDLLDKLDCTRVEVIADCNKLSYLNSIPLDVRINGESSSTYGNDYSVDLSENTLQVLLEDIITTELDIEVEFTGDEPEEYYVSNIELIEDTLMVAGPKSLINTLDKVVIQINRDELLTNIKSKSNTNILYREYKPIIKDRNGDIIDNDKLTLGLDIIGLNIELYKTKLVNLNLKTPISNPVLHDIITGITCDFEQIYITGPDEVIENYNTLDVVYNIDIALSDITKTQFVKSVSLQELVPEGIIIIPKYNKINVTIDFLTFYTKAIAFNTDDIVIEGLDDKYKATIADSDIMIDIVGTTDDIETKTLKDISPYVNLAGLEPGVHTVTVQYKNYTNNIFIKVKVDVVISDSEEEIKISDESIGELV